jgi:hypothetical protein
VSIDKLLNFIREQKEEPEEQEEKQPDEQEELPEETEEIEQQEQPTGQPQLGNNQVADPYGMDPQLEVEEEPEIDVGSALKLKKIYVKLLSLSDILEYYSTNEFDEIKDRVYKSLEYFDVLSENLDQYKDKLDSIIEIYKKFLVATSEELERLIKKENE